MQHTNDEREVDIILMTQVYGEFVEMPGLRLTIEQASRLWNMRLKTSAQVLDRLVDASFLRRAGAHYLRADSGRSAA